MVRRKHSRSRSGTSHNSLHNVTDKNSSSSNTTKKRKPTRKNVLMIGSKMFTVSVKTMREVRRLQLTTALLIPKLCFARVVKEVLGELNPNLRIQAETLLALQESAEAYMVHLFEDSYLCALHCRRITLFPKDMQLALRLRGPWDYLQ